MKLDAGSKQVDLSKSSLKKTRNFLAIDFGASNGRAIVGRFNGGTLELDEVHRFENRPVYMGNTYYWDFPRLFLELKTGISEALKRYKKIDSLGVETWGCDFGLLDNNKMLLSNPVHYRDKRTVGLAKEMQDIIPDWDMYKRTQAQILEINTVYQLYFLKKIKSPILENARHFLLLGDLFNFFLTGEIICEFSNATLTQLLNQGGKIWENHIIRKIGLPEYIFTEITQPGKIIGNLSSSLQKELGAKEIPVSLPAYDTTSEIAAIPVSNKNKDANWAYLNCGTWAMAGIITGYPIVSKAGFERGFGNEGGFAGRYHYLKNMIGLWIIQQCRKKWMEEKGEISWKEIDSLTAGAANSNVFIDVDDSVFEREIFDMPSVVLRYCNNTGQMMPQDIGGMSRALYESLALKYILNIKKLEKITGKKIELLHLVGGGSNNILLCQWLADASGLTVIAGPQETTTAGNLLAQMVATKSVSGIDEARHIFTNSVDLKTYEPKKSNYLYWQDKLDKYLNILKLSI